MKPPAYRPVGDGYLWSCDLCGCAVASENRGVHDEWHYKASVTTPAETDCQGYALGASCGCTCAADCSLSKTSVTPPGAGAGDGHPDMTKTPATHEG